jgi:hypothetical protein
MRSKKIRLPMMAGESVSRCIFYAAIALVMAAWFGRTGVALAHEGEPLAPHELWSAWNWDLLILAGLTAAGWSYGTYRYSMKQPCETNLSTSWSTAAFWPRPSCSGGR